MDLIVGKSVYDTDVNTAHSSLLLWKAVVPPVHLLQKCNLTIKEVPRKSENTLHTIEIKKFAFSAFGRLQGQKNATVV